MMKIRSSLNAMATGLFAKKVYPLLPTNNKLSEQTGFNKPLAKRSYTSSITSLSNNTIARNKPAFFPETTLSAIQIDNAASSFSCEPILSEITRQLDLADEKPFKKVMVVAVQHILGTTVEMFRALKSLGLERAIIGGKSYSTHEGSARALETLGYTFIEAPDQIGYGRYESCMQQTTATIWHTALQSLKKEPVDLLIILDDGGDLILSTPGKLFNGISYKPKRVIGIEQTRGGSNHRCFNGVPFPIINVAGSYIKTTIEYPWVAEIIANEVIKEIHEKAKANFVKKPIIGVVGNGTMGMAIISKFVAQGYCVLAYDKAHKKIPDKKIIWYTDITSLMSNADIIIGCTGTDITENPNNLNAILNSVKPKYLVSTSSKDIEFNSLLLHIQEITKKLGHTPDPLENIEYLTPFDYKITLLKGGFPLNFNNKKHSVPPEKIWPTRAALLGACLMAVHAHNKEALKTADVLKLDAYIQKLILHKYSSLNPDDPAVRTTKLLTDEELTPFILERSDGNQLDIELKPRTSIQHTQKP